MQRVIFFVISANKCELFWTVIFLFYITMLHINLFQLVSLTLCRHVVLGINSYYGSIMYVLQIYYGLITTASSHEICLRFRKQIFQNFQNILKNYTPVFKDICDSFKVYWVTHRDFVIISLNIIIIMNIYIVLFFEITQCCVTLTYKIYNLQTDNILYNLGQIYCAQTLYAVYTMYNVCYITWYAISAGHLKIID